jgi:hypothetical protein
LIVDTETDPILMNAATTLNLTEEQLDTLFDEATLL